ncbi:MAG: phospholipid-binding lipoprotein MlaA [Pseudohongiellaceae bacterium]|jgi:phospholipid-binding lipoprotein MlaA
MFHLKKLAYSLLLFVFCSAVNAEAIDVENQRDPWESFNRKVFVFNDTADQYLLAPVARGYQTITPDPVEDGLGNVFSNLHEITNIANDLLQFEFARAGVDTGRFLINSTIGLLGFFDVASKVGLEKEEQDFGLTLASWGLDSGPYIMIPFMGPSTLRDGVGTAVDRATTDIAGDIDHVPTRNAMMGIKVIDTRAGLLQAEKLITGDRYSFIRDVYLQRRDAAAGLESSDDSFGEEDFDSFEEWE